MAFKNLPIELVVPADATTGTPRIVITKTIPPDLIAHPGIGVMSSVILFMSTSDNTFGFIGISTTGELTMGYCQAGNVAYLLSMTQDQLYLTSALFQDVTDFSTRGIWTQVSKVNGWTDIAGNGILSYRRVPSPNESVQLTGRVVTGGGGVLVGTLPVGFRPATQIQTPVTNNGTAAVFLAVITTGGAINAPAASGDYTFNCIFPLDL